MLDVIDEGTQLRHHLPVAGIIEKHARRPRRERLQQADELARFHRIGRDRSGHLGKAKAVHGRGKQGGNVVGDEGA